MESITITELKPITEMCSILVNMNEPLDLKKIDGSIEAFMIASFYIQSEINCDNKDWKFMNKKDYELMKLTLKMEMILRNIILNDKSAMKLTNSQLEGYLTAKAYIITGHYPSLVFTKSVIKTYRDLVNVSNSV